MTPIERIKFQEYIDCGINVFLKRDDLLHPSFCGNKWRKLKYQLASFHSSDKKSIITWGGVMSNHLYAISHLVAEQNIPVTVYLPVDQESQHPYSFKKAVKNGITPHYVSRSEYRQRYDAVYMGQLAEKFPNVMFIPEGGSHPDSLEGIEEMVTECKSQCSNTIDYWVLPVGTGGTMLGILETIDDGEVIGISAVKKGRQNKWINSYLSDRNKIKWQVNQDYHIGGMGRYSEKLINVMRRFNTEYSIKLDPIYTGKMVVGLMDLIDKKRIKPNSTVMMIHTGGLIGIDNFKEKNKEIIF